MIVVSDASPILNLAAVGQLDLLHNLYGGVLIPGVVAIELERNGLASVPPWISVRNPANTNQVSALGLFLDAGESEAIVLAEEQTADLLLIDERRGWKIATSRSLRCVGLLGVLAEAKSKGLLNSCQSVLDEMISHAGFWIGDSLRDRFLAAIGEGPKI